MRWRMLTARWTLGLENNKLFLEVHERRRTASLARSAVDIAVKQTPDEEQSASSHQVDVGEGKVGRRNKLLSRSTDASQSLLRNAELQVKYISSLSLIPHAHSACFLPRYCIEHRMTMSAAQPLASAMAHPVRKLLA